MNIPLYPLRSRGAAGFTLIEVLITVLVMALGLLGGAALQAVALKNNRTALQHSYAQFYAYEIADCMRANRPAAVAGSYNLDFNSPASGSSIAASDMGTWKAALAQDLPSGEGKVTVQADGAATIWVRWSEGIHADRTVTFTTQTTL